MNCKPGDLAVIIGGEYEPFIGQVVRCISVCTERNLQFEPHWNTEPELFFPGYWIAAGIADSTLRPICDPGEDAQDETLEWLPVPSGKEPA